MIMLSHDSKRSTADLIYTNTKLRLMIVNTYEKEKNESDFPKKVNT